MRGRAKGLDDLEGILEKARHFDETALATLAEEYYPAIFRYFYYRTPTREDAEDLTSEVFVRMIGAIKNQKGYFPAWLYRIASNLLTDYYRKKKIRREVSLETMNIESLPDPNKGEDTIGLSTEDIRRMLEQITPEQREVIILRFLEGYSAEETAQILHKSVGAIKALQFRAFISLKEILKREEGHQK
ncbi:MAG: sigma-70 family RNA polymerase sigma factor [Caldiserica bacterium]|nr:sigma-70 family RNA polymerase sigma factor [Caldisericota bacterium]